MERIFFSIFARKFCITEEKRNIMIRKLFKTSFPLVALFFVAMLLGACSQEKFHIKGSVANAKDSTLYLENMGLDGAVVIDSVKLDETGNFDFAEKTAEAPEFYRLRIANQIINVSIDSTETVGVKATYPNMAVQYEVEGSENCKKIQELAYKQINLQARVIDLQRNSSLGYEATNDSILKLVEAYKNEVKRDYIFKEPMKAYAYFALFQTLGNQLIFNPRSSKDDVKVFAAVATSWDTFYPEALRGKNLHNIALEGMKTQRIVESKRNMQIDPSVVNVSNIIDIELTDNKGYQRKLTDLVGKVVLLDFHVFATKSSTARIMKLREVYNKYHAQGLEIYQVSFDPDEHFWKQQTAALPWVSVRDARGVDSPLMVEYNLQAIPTFFIIDKTGALYKRDAQIKDLDAEIKRLL